MGVIIAFLCYVIPIGLTIVESIWCVGLDSVALDSVGLDSFSIPWIIGVIALLILGYVTLGIYNKADHNPVVGHIFMSVLATYRMAVAFDSFKTTQQSFFVLVLVSTLYLLGMPIFGYCLYCINRKKQYLIKNEKIIQEGKTLVTHFFDSPIVESLTNKILYNLQLSLDDYFPEKDKTKNASRKTRFKHYTISVSKTQIDIYSFEDMRMRNLTGLPEQYALLEAVREKMLAKICKEDNMTISFSEVKRSTEDEDEMVFTIDILAQNPDYVEAKDW